MMSALAVFIAPAFLVAWVVGRFLLFRPHFDAFSSLHGKRARNAQSISSFFKLIVLLGGLMFILMVAQELGWIATYILGAVLGLVFSMIEPFVLILFYVFTRDSDLLP